MYFTHLHVHSHYSLLDGLSKIDDLILKASEMGLDSLALTDHGVLYGAVEFYFAAKAKGLKPIIGCEVYLAPRALSDKVAKLDTNFSHLVLLAKNQTGYKNLLKLVTIGELEGFYYKPRIDKKTLSEHSDGLIGLSACWRGEIPQALLAGNLEQAKELVFNYQNIFGKENFYLELQDHPESADQNKINKLLIDLAQETKTPLVITCDSHYLNKEDKKIHEILLAIQTGVEMESEDRLSMKEMDLSLKHPEEIITRWADYPQVFDNIQKIVSECNVNLEPTGLIFPKFALDGNKDHFEYLKELAWEGFNRLCDNNDEKAKERLVYELSVIKQTNFSDYFLVIYDFIHYAKNNGILTNTRGSAGNSLVAYLLGITNINPLIHDLYFERFLNPERIQPPDIDVDVSDDKRAILINYLGERYGKDHVAQLITFGIMQSRLAVRDVNRALGYPYSLGDEISKLIPANMSLTEVLEKTPELKKKYETEEAVKEIIDIAQKLEGVARHASTHAAGVVITPEPLCEYTPLQHSSRDARETITQYDMYSLEKIGLIKIDILGLANLTVIKNTLRIIKKVYGEEIDLDALGFEDKKTYELISRGETVGVFQLGSEGIRKYLQELQPSCFEDIVAILALYRPGPMELIPQFIRRKHNKEQIVYLHPKLKPILENTYGICIYQEQLMRIAHDLAGFSISEADTLRKAVGKKIKSLLDSQKAKMVDGMINNGISKAVAIKIWEWIEPFARYGFNKGHSVSYARITYETAYLKAHYPNAFMAALLTSDYGNLDKIAVEINECEKLGIKVLPPSVNNSFVEFGTDKETGNIYFSLASIKNVGLTLATIIQEERTAHGLYKNLSDFLDRIPRQNLNRKSLESLIKAGALDCFGSRELMAANLDAILDWAYKSSERKNQAQMLLFGSEESRDILEKLIQEQGVPPVDKTQRISWEREYLGLYLTLHPLEDYQKVLTKVAALPSAVSLNQVGARIKIGGFISNIQKIRTKKGEAMAFLNLSDENKNIEIVLFPSVLNQYLTVLAQDKIVVVEGKVDKRNGSYQVIGEKLEEIKPLEL